jgi:hypothetical protein
MWGFWLLFLLPLLAVLAPGRLPAPQAKAVWVLVVGLMTLLIGLRDQVGGDWGAYLTHFQDIARMRWGEVLEYGDPGYYLLNWLVAQVGGDVYAINLVCAAVLMAGTARFCREQPRPWLALLVAVSYLLVVVGMGYTRQSVALGLAMFGLVALGDGRVRAFVLWVAVAALFHKTAVLLIPIAALAVRRRRAWTTLWVAVAALLAYWALLDEAAEFLWLNYVDEEMESQGGAIRVAMNAVPAVLLLLFRRRLLEDAQERSLWTWMALIALACVPLVFLASTAVDRMALYLIPLQMLVFSRLHRLAPGKAGRTLVVLAIVAYYAAVLWVWLNFATHAQYWVPYRFMPLW